MRLVAIAVVAAAWAQAGSITGSITDPGGSAVPKAEVQATQLETGKEFSAAASTNGSYTFVKPARRHLPM